MQKAKEKKVRTELIVGLLFAVALLTSGCAIHIGKDNQVDGFWFTEVKKTNLGKNNYAVLQKKYGKEWNLNRGDKNAPPALGLAMSGGGMRSAAFNIGVLKGLHEADMLGDIDIMSSVSGGGYAMSWYYLQKLNSREQDEDIFDPEGRFQKHLEENGRIVTHSDKFVVQAPEYLVKLGANIVAIPLHWFANGLFDWKLNLAPYRWFYQNAIEREFHLTPEKEGSGFVNDSSIARLPIGVKDEKRVRFSKMREFIEDEDTDLPAFVINTTAKITDNMHHYGADFGNTIFEFTPFAFGSDAFGYRFDDFPIDIHTAVAISGAAADSSILPSKMGFMMSALNTDLGYNIPNYNIDQPSKIVRHNLLPFPFYFAYRSNNDIRGTRIYLTDGGHSDNLGAYALVKRLCKNIIIVDAEHDPEYRFQAYRKLKERLKKELRVDFSLPDIDKGLRLFSIELKGDEALHEKIVSDELAQKVGFEAAVKVEYDKEAELWRLTEKKENGRTVFALKEKGTIVVFDEYNGSKPVMEGSISWFPLEKDGEVEKITLNVTYIKLSLDLGNLDMYPASVSNYLKEDKHWFKALTGFQDTSFPHEDTSDISYGKAQFSAYRDLGSYIVKKYCSR